LILPKGFTLSLITGISYINILPNSLPPRKSIISSSPQEPQRKLGTKIKSSLTFGLGNVVLV